MKNSKKKHNNIKSNLIYQMIYRILVLITPLITSPYISRILGAESLGEYSFTLSIVNYFTIIAYLGIDNYGCKMIARIDSDKERKMIFWEIYYLQLFTGIIALILFILYCFIFVDKNMILFLIQIFAILTAMLDINWYFTGTEQFKLITIRNVIVKIGIVLSIFMFVKSHNDTPIYALIMVLGNVISQLVMWGNLLKNIGIVKFDLPKSLKHLKPNISLFIPVIAITVYHTMDKTMLGILSNYENVGYYYNADKIINMPLGLITAMGTVMLPRMSNILANKGLDEAKKLLNKSFELNLFLSCCISFGIASVSAEFVPWFFGKEFEPCILLIRIFAPVLVIKSLSGFIQTQFLIPNNNETIYTVAAFTGALVNLLFNILLIPEYGAMGASIGTLFAELTLLLVEAIFIIKKYNIFKLIYHYIIYIISTIIMTVGVNFISFILDISIFEKLVVEIVLGALIYLIVLIPYWFINETSIFNKYIKKCALFKKIVTKV